MNFKGLLLMGLIAVGVLAGCSSTRTIEVAVPPAVDLAGYQTIGLVGFSTNADKSLEGISTQRFLEALQAAQPGTRIVELGPEERVLRSVDRRGWNPATFKAVQEQHGVDGIMLGRLNIVERKPDVQISNIWKAVSVSSDVEASLSAKLIEAASGATMWADSASVVTNVAHAAFNNHGDGHFGVRDADGAYSAMIDGLAYQITDDFRVHYVTRRVSKEEYERSVSAEGQ